MTTRNRLSAAAGVTYNYNGRGERVSKSSPKHIVRLLGKRSMLGEYNSSGVAQKEIFRWMGVYVGVVVSGTLYYVETDQLGTPRQVILPGATMASDTTVVEVGLLASNSAFGRMRRCADDYGQSEVSGQYFDAETGLSYNYFRDYEAGTGRYVEADIVLDTVRAVYIRMPVAILWRARITTGYLM